jgi:hypothetical protein
MYEKDLNKEKQIGEKVKVISDICPFYKEYGTCKQCNTELDVKDEPCYWECIANAIIRNGYRKASEVARETVEAIKAEVSKEEQYVNDLFGYGDFVIATTDLEDIIRRYMFDTYEEAELKKKYTEGEG